MFIQTQDTPNPDTLKFIPGCTVLNEGTLHFDTKSEATPSPLALALFDMEGVKHVFFGADFISITKQAEREWHTLKPGLLGIIMEHFVAKRPVLSKSLEEIKATPADEFSDEIIDQIRDLIETRVRPAVAMDGGDIIFKSFEDGVVYLKLQGSCSGCPSATVTLKDGIENMLKHYVPEVVRVESVE